MKLKMCSWALIFVLSTLAQGSQRPFIESVILVGTLIDGKSQSPPRLKQMIFVGSDGKILSVVDEGFPIPEGVQVFDFRQQSVMPGLIDPHAHILSKWSAEFGDVWQNLAHNSAETMNERLAHGQELAREVLTAGFTTVRNVGNSGHGGDIILKKQIESGQIEGPRILASSRSISPPGGQFMQSQPITDALVKSDYIEVSTVSEATRAVNSLIEDGVDLIKVIADNEVEGEKQPRLISIEVMRTIVEQAHQHHIKVASHAMTLPGFENALEAGVDSIEHASHYQEKFVPLLKQLKTTLVPTYLPGAYWANALRTPNQTDDEVRAAALQGEQRRIALVSKLRSALKENIPVVPGSDAMYSFKDQSRGQSMASIYGVLAKAQFTNQEIIEMATSQAARLLGIESDTGTIEPGKRADLIVLKVNPLDDINSLTQVLHVIKSGKLVR